MTRSEYQEAVREVEAAGRGLARILPFVLVAIVVWLGVMYALRPVQSSTMKFVLLVGLFPVALFLVVFRTARRIDTTAARVGLRCTKCRRWLWAIAMRSHVEHTGCCKNCGARVIDE